VAVAGTHPDPPAPRTVGEPKLRPEPVCVASLRAAITRSVLADEQAQRESQPAGEDPHRAGCDPVDAHPSRGIPPGPYSPASARPGLRSARWSRTGRRIRATADGYAEGSTPATVNASLRARAVAAGLPTLPGPGSLTLATRALTGGRDTLLAYIRLAAVEGDPSAQTWLHVYDSLKAWERKVATLDDVCVAGGVSPVKLLKAIVGVAFEAGIDVANLVSAQAHPDVVQASIRVAKTNEGIEDRKLLFQHHNFVPIPKGATIAINVSANATANAASLASADQSVPNFLQDVETLQAPKREVQEAIVAELPAALSELADQFNSQGPEPENVL
jgi:hypothetical protein